MESSSIFYNYEFTSYDVLNIDIDDDKYILSTSLVSDEDVFDNETLTLKVDKSSKDKVDAFITQTMGMSDAHKVKQFTEESNECECPNTPRKMDRGGVEFIIKMVISEMTELAQTVCDSPEDALKLIHDCVGTDFNKNYVKPTTDAEIIAEQYDSFVDSYYYTLNTAAKNGVNLSKIFNEVHQANMNKRWPDGKFHKRDDGKVIKPELWKPANIVSEVKKQIYNGAW